uniref:Uncharacterized protein n=1 Tax=Anguilla anguilla TaxID=7936 RepID=A0A0E9W6R6_ANGAN
MMEHTKRQTGKSKSKITCPPPSVLAPSAARVTGRDGGRNAGGVVFRCFCSFDFLFL